MEEKPVISEESNELYEHFRFVVDRGQEPVRIDKYLFAKLSSASRNRIQNAARAGNILVNDQPVKSNYKVRPGDVISIVLAFPPRDTEIYPENIPVQVIYEDDAGNPFLDHAIWAHETLVRHRPQDVVPHGTSTRLFTAISAATPLPLLTNVAILTPAMALELAGPGDGPALEAFSRLHGHLVQAVNLCGSLVDDPVDGVFEGTQLVQSHLDAAVDRLLATRGRALHPRDLHSAAPAAQSRGR